MPSRPLWNIPDPADAARNAKARHQVAETQKRDRVKAAADRKAKRQREAVLIRENETKRRAEERRQWLAAHTAPTREELAALLEEFPNLKGKLSP